MAKTSPTPGFDPKKVEARIQGRKAAKSILAQKMLSWPRGMGADFADALCEELRSQLPQHPDAEPTPREPLARLAAIEIPFGKYAGRRLDDIPPDYLGWLADEKRHELKQITDYLNHPERPQDE